MRLCDLRTDEYGVVTKLKTLGALRGRMLDLGLVEGTRVMCVGHSPCGDPSAYMIRGAVIAIRKQDAQTVLIKEA